MIQITVNTLIMADFQHGSLKFSNTSELHVNQSILTLVTALIDRRQEMLIYNHVLNALESVEKILDIHLKIN